MAMATTTVVQTGGGMRSWTTGLFDCFSDMGSCIIGCICPCVLLCQNAGSLGENGFCLCCCIPQPWGQLALRVKLRSQNGIQGDITSDCMHVCCCGPCALCQEAREIKHLQLQQTTTTTTTVIQQPVAQAAPGY